MSEVRVCAVLLFVFVYTISLSNSADAGDKQTNDAVAGFFRNETLTEKQEKSIVTIEFNCTVIDRENRTALNSIYLNVHEAILERLNRRKSYMTTTVTIAATTTGNVVPPVNKKKRKKRENSLAQYDAKDLRFVEIDPEFDENGILRVTLLLVGKDDRDCGIILLEAANETNIDGTLETVTGVPVVAIYRGLPGNRNTMASGNYNHHYLIWPLVILFVIVLFIVIGGVIYWKKQQDRLEVTGQRK